MQHPSQQYVEQRLQSFYTPIHSAFSTAFQQMRHANTDSWPTFKARSRASVFHDYLIRNLQAFLGGSNDARYVEQRGMSLWMINEEIALRVKKLDDKKLSSNHYTQQSFNFVNQQFLLPGIHEIISLNLGYRINDIWTAFSIHITCPSGKRKILWSIDINDIIQHINNITILPFPDEEEEDNRQVFPKGEMPTAGEMPTERREEDESGGHA